MQPALAPAPHPMQNAVQDNPEEQSLREHLLAQVHSPQGPHNMENMQPSSSASPHDHNIDPAIAGTGMMNTSAESGDDVGADGRKGGKRELSTSKRAAQNRAAQRAFRQRKEGYIKKLEEQVRDYNLLNENYKAVQAENYQLRDYIINLQSRLIESQGDFPQPPSNIDLPNPRSSDPMHQQQQQIPAPTATMASSSVSHLQASAAQAVADLGAGKHHHEEAAYLTGGSDFPSKRLKTGEDVEMQSATDPALTNQKPDINGTSVTA